MLGVRAFGFISSTLKRAAVSGSNLAAEASGLLIQIWQPTYQPLRTNVRNHFPKPSEIRRVRRHGWKTRLSTVSGQKIIMRRILKGRHVLSH